MRISAEPRYIAIANQLKNYIKHDHSSSTVLGRLPSISTLSRMFSTSKDNMSMALQMLQDDGIVEIRKSSGCYIARGAWELLYSSAPNWHKMMRDSWYAHRTAMWQQSSGQAINFSVGVLSEEFGYSGYIAAAMLEAAKIISKERVLGNLDQQGLPSLRESIAAYLLKYKNIVCSPDEVICTLGASQNANVVAQSLMGHNALMLSHSPNPLLEMTALSAYGVQFNEFKLKGRTMDLQHLESLIGNNRRSLIFMCPNKNYPTGVTISEDSRRDTVELCAALNTPIFEVDYFSDFEDELPLPMKSMDNNGSIIYGGTLGCSLAIGIPVNWLVVPRPLVGRFTEIVAQNNALPATLPQVVLDVILRSGAVEDFFRNAKPFYKNRIEITKSLFAKHLGGYFKWDDSDIGLYAWLETLDKGYIDKLMSCAGIFMLTGTVFGKSYKNFLPFAPSVMSEADLIKGIQLMGDCLRRT